MFPPLEQEADSSTLPMPAGSFITCSSDDTIRVWNLEPTLPPDNDTMYKKNIYSNVSKTSICSGSLEIRYQ